MRRIGEGVVREGELYTVRQLKVRLGLSDSAWRAMRQRGLPHHLIGKRVFVSGREVIAFVERGLFDDGESVCRADRREVLGSAVEGRGYRPVAGEVGEDRR